MPSAPQSFLDPALLARISDLSLLARTVVDGFMHGQHRSLRKGSSMDFAQHRSYQPGDDLRRVDWRVLGRTDRYYVKEFEADTNASVIFALDASASMGFGSGKVNKYDYGRFLIASLAWLSQHQGDRVGLATFTGELVDVVPRRRGTFSCCCTRSVAPGRPDRGISWMRSIAWRTWCLARASWCSSPTATRRRMNSAAPRMRCACVGTM